MLTGRKICDFTARLRNLDVGNCGIKCYNLLKMVYELAWFVGGDANKIKKLQGTLRRQGYSKVVQDGVYGAETEKAWLDYVNKALMPYQRYNDANVWGISVYKSNHKIGGSSKGLTIYIDDDFNIAIMGTVITGVTSDFEVSKGVTVEWSRTATSVSDMEGKSVTFGGGGDVFVGGVAVGHSESFGNSTVDSNSISIYSGSSVAPVAFSGGVSTNIPLVQFNPKDWIRRNLQIK